MTRLFSMVVVLFALGCGLDRAGDASSDAGVTGGDAGVVDGGPSAPVCLSALRGAPLPAPDGAAYAYDTCAGSDNVLVSIPGTGDASENDVQAVRLAVEDALLGIDGVVGIQTSRCCGVAGQPLCVSVMLSRHTSPLEAVADVVAAEAHRASVGCMGLEVEWLGRSTPRCQPTDDDCAPLPMCPRVTDPDCCPAVTPYTPGKARVRMPPLFDEFSRGACMQDGDCYQNGAGNHCTSWDSPAFIAPLACIPELREANCGCVDGACAWFTQP